MKERGDDYSDMEISESDGDNEEIKEKDIDEMIYRLEKQEMKKVPPHCSDDLDEFDTRGACLIIVDGPTLKKKNQSDYHRLIQFWFQCLHKRNLPLFTHPGDPDFVDGGMISMPWIRASKNKENIKLAKRAVNHYNKLIKAKKLKFKEVVKANCTWEETYLTFSAIDLDTGECGMYQAAFKELINEKYVLGLLRECSAEKILVVMSITGAEEELAANRKFFDELKAMKGKKSTQD